MRNVWLSLLAAAALLAARLWLPDIAVIVVAAVWVVVAFWLGYARRGAPRPGGKWMAPAAIFALLTGAVIVFLSAYDAIQWLIHKQITSLAATGTFWFLQKQPSMLVATGAINAVLFALTILCGWLAGIFLMRLGLDWLSDRTGKGLTVWALAPVAWMWFRLAQYEISYASAAALQKSLWDFLLLCFSLVFFLMLARYVSGVHEKPLRFLPSVAMCAAAFSIFTPVWRLVMQMQGTFSAQSAGQAASPADLLIGLTALLLLGMWRAAPAAPQAEPKHAADAPQTETAVRADAIPQADAAVEDVGVQGAEESYVP
ncbi:MAG: hypothetical protein FWF49_01395 [Oscillospiraceae bacterium]|nr:hypothetical protein [Oscillospiraceae bacterium]